MPNSKQTKCGRTDCAHYEHEKKTDADGNVDYSGILTVCTEGIENPLGRCDKFSLRQQRTPNPPKVSSTVNMPKPKPPKMTTAVKMPKPKPPKMSSTVNMPKPEGKKMSSAPYPIPGMETKDKRT